MHVIRDGRGIRHLCMSLRMLLAFVLSSCSSFNVTVHDPQLPVAQTTPILDGIGIYFSPEFHRADVSHQLMADYGHQLKTDLGPASVAMFESILRSVFPHSELVSADAVSSGNLVILVPSVDLFEYTFGPETARVNARVVYGLTVLRPGEESMKLHFEGLYDSSETPSPGSSIIYSAAPRYINQAMRNAGTKLVLLLHEVADADDWLLELERYKLVSE